MTTCCPECRYFGGDCNPDVEDYEKECLFFDECGDKEWCMRNGLWDMEDEINDADEDQND
jgi:hypothetical protein